ncbi:MAG: class I SAM-dependent rRNA methyltransferase [Candidatus Omnitrophica bacterium]|nr:class I SAM-dependent rRNA methyltransferase [Candidatus Omnitrophota bacterium]MCM8791306.1 class I SAM-dependent rRNA methyltransferase [Candidatus Omnitrophota bacterium]
MIRKGHPWIYKSQLLKSYNSLRPGGIVALQDANGRYIGKGYFNPRSQITVRLLTFGDEPINAAFFAERIREAVKKREGLSDKTNAYRVIYSEADGLPGIIVDMYADTAVAQVNTLGMDRLKGLIFEKISELLKPAYIYEKSDSAFREQEGLKPAIGWHGAKGHTKIEIFEGKARFLVDIENGHKTGFYLDQRNSRLSMHTISKGKSVLDLFCYTGAFAVHSALYGASSVLACDIKDDWLALGRENAALNGVAGKIEFVSSDAFDLLENIYKSGRTFDIIILDPPSFVKTRRSLDTAIKGYRKLNTMAMRLLKDRGVLATFSCSHNMPNEVLSTILKESAEKAGKKFSLLKRCHQAEDHPIVRDIPETEYLKGYFLKVDSQ